MESGAGHIRKVARAVVSVGVSFALCTGVCEGAPLPATAQSRPELATASPAAEDAASGADSELIVTYAAGRDIAAIARGAGVCTDETDLLARNIGSNDIALVELAGSQDDADAIARLERDPRVIRVERNQTFRLHTSVNDTYAAKSYQLANEHITTAWSTAKAQGKVAIAVLDTGVTMDEGYRNPEFSGIVDYASAWDATTQAALASDYRDYDGHGTAVAAVAAARANNARGIAGASYNAKIIPIRVFDDNDECKESYLIAAYNRILQTAKSLNIRVVNMSFGTDGGIGSLQALINRARGQGVLSVASAGNYEKTWQQAYALKSYPASSSNVVSVAAVNGKRAHASFSYHNSAVDICAAGVGVYSLDEWDATAVEVVELGGRGRQQRTYTEYTNVSYHPNRYTQLSGTSFSCPIVAGIAALLFAKNPALSAAQAESALEKTARDLGARGKDSYYGYGEVDATAAVLSVTAPAIKRVSRAKGAFKVTWSKLSGVKKYRVSYRKAGSKKWKHVDVKSSKASRKINRLKRRKSYEVRVRAYTTKSAKKVWTKYSAKVKIRTK